jgi:hypothetical protein
MDTRGDIVRLAHRGLGVEEFSLAAARLIFDHYAPKL